MHDLVVHLDRVNNATSVESLWRLHLDAMATFGFDRLLYGYTRYRSGRSLGDPQDWVVLTNLPSAYMRPYVEEGLYQNGPMVRWAIENEGACSWSWMAEMVAKGDFSAAELRTLEFNRKLGVTAGYTISFRSVSKRAKGGIGLCARPGMSQQEVEHLWSREGPTITVMNNVFHLKLLTLPYSGSRTAATGGASGAASRSPTGGCERGPRPGGASGAQPAPLLARPTSPARRPGPR